MKTTTTLIAMIAAFTLAAAPASAQDDDDDLFGEGGGEDLSGDGDGSGTDTSGDSDAGTGDANVTDTSGGSTSHPLGFGFSTGVLGIQSLSSGAAEVEYWIGDKLAINGLGRILFLSPDVGDSQIAIQVGGGILFAFKRHGPAALLVGARALLGFTSGDAGTTSFAIEAPLRLQVWLTDRLSMHAEGGLGIGIGDQGGLNLSSGGESFALFIGSRNLFGDAGFTAYF